MHRKAPTRDWELTLGAAVSSTSALARPLARASPIQSVSRHPALAPAAVLTPSPRFHRGRMLSKSSSSPPPTPFTFSRGLAGGELEPARPDWPTPLPARVGNSRAGRTVTDALRLFRHSVTGHVATVFGATGMLGRYLVSKLGTASSRRSGRGAKGGKR